MKNYLLSVFLTAIASGAFAQTSKLSITGFWEQASTWTGGTIPGSVSGGTITANTKTVIVNGTVKTHSNVTLNTLSSLTINAGDTLVVFGNLTISGASSLTNNGVLMVTGNLANNLSGVSNSSTGKMVVMGNYNNGLGVVNDFTGPSYVYGSDNGFLFAPSTSSQATMVSNDPALNAFVNWMFGILPIQLVSFKAAFQHQHVALTWITSSESGNDHFTLERSSDKNDFQPIATVGGSVSSKELKTYSFTDNEPLTGTSYYRLGQVDMDGKLTLLSVIFVENNEKVSIQAYPNPATDYLFITGVQENDNVSINDASGVYQSRNYQVSEVLPGRTGIDVSDLETGIYSIHVTSSANNLSRSLRFVKH